MDTVSNLFSTWWKKPFDPNGDAVSWVLFLGFIIVVAIAWSRVLKHITE